MNLRRSLSSPMAALLAAAGVLGTATVATFAVAAPPAGATAADPVTIAVGQTFTKSYPAIQGQNEVGQEIGGEAGRQGVDTGTYPYPENCASSTSVGCVTIPVKLAVDPKTIASHQYVFGATITWPNKIIVGGIYGDTQGLITNIQSDNIEGFIWNIPHGNGTDGSPVDGYAAKGDLGTAPPMGLSDITITTPNVAVVVANEAGQNSGFSVTFSLTDATGGPLTDLSIDKSGAIVDKSALPDSSVTPSFQQVGQTSSPTPTIAPIAGVTSPETGKPLSLVQIAGDPQLDALKPTDDRQALAAEAPKHIGKLARVLGPATPVSGTKALIWLVAVPIALLLIALAVLLQIRRRSEGLDV